MKKVFVIVAVLGIICAVTTSSYSADYWARTYGGSEEEIASPANQTSDGGYIIAGSTRSFSATYTDGLILKLDENGLIIWSKKYAEAYWDDINDIKQTSDGGFIAIGNHYVPNPNIDNVWAMKLDATGNIIWKSGSGVGFNNFNDFGHRVQETPDGGYLILGRTNAYGNYDMCLTKFDANGILSWQTTYGGVNDEQVASFEKTSDGGYIVAGSTNSSGSGGYDFWLLKLNNLNGELYVGWQKTFGGINDDFANFAEETTDGYIVAGETSSFGAGNSDALILKLDSYGNFQWGKTYGQVNDDGASSIRQRSDGGYMVAGCTSSFGAGDYDVWIMELDSNGGIITQKTFGGEYRDDANSIQKTSDGSYVLSGNTFSNTAGNSDFWVLKLSANGDLPGCYISGTSDAVVSDTPILGQSFNTISHTSNWGSYTTAHEIDENIQLKSIFICYSSVSDVDTDSDGILDSQDNCLTTPNGPDLGTCCKTISGVVMGMGTTCHDNIECEVDEVCDLSQADFDSDGAGDSCECYSNANCDKKVDLSDLVIMKTEFLRNNCPSCQ